MAQTFTFRLTAEGVQQLQRDFESLGERGAAAFQRLQAAAPQLASGMQRATAEIERGAQRSEAALSRLAGKGGGGSGAINQIGFQVTDLATQIQGGTSAFTAFAQQGGQLAGALLGGFAGLAVSAAAIGAQILFAGDATETAAEKAKKFQTGAEALNAVLKTSAERAREAAFETRKLADAFVDADLQRLIQQQNDARSRLFDPGQFAAGQLGSESGVGGDNDPELAAILRRRGGAGDDRLRKQIDELQGLIDQRRGDRARLDRGDTPGLNETLARGGAGGGAKDRTDELANALGRLRDQYAGVIAEEERLAENRKEGARITEEVRTAEEKYAATIERLNLLRDEGAISAETYARAISQAEDVLNRADGSAKRAADAARQLGLTFSSAFEDAIVRGEKFSDVLAGLGQDIARLLIRQSVTEPLAGAARDIIGGLDFGSIFGGARASGGPVGAGRAYLVGERGPEIMLTGSAGRVMPNDAIGGVTVVQNNDFRGADASILPTLEARLARHKVETAAAVADASRRGGSYARSIRGR